SRRMRLTRVVRIAESTLVRVPMVVGYLQPMILLPASVLTGLSPTQLEALLAHELAHVRRHDWLVNALQVLAETLFFFHPAVWRLSKRIRNERELCCDDIALSLINDKAVFERTLLILEELRQTTFVTALAATDGDLVQRVSRLMPSASSIAHSPGPTNVGACLTAMLALGLVLMLAFGTLAKVRDTGVRESLATAPSEQTTLGRARFQFIEPRGATLQWEVSESRKQPRSASVTLPSMLDFATGEFVQLRLAYQRGKPGADIVASLQILPSTPATTPIFAEYVIPLEFSTFDLDEVSTGQRVTKAVYLPDARFREGSTAILETLSATRLDAGITPTGEAQRRGVLLAVLIVGSADRESSGDLRPDEKRGQEIRAERAIAKPKRTTAEIAARDAELQRQRAEGQAALEHGDYQAMANRYETLARAPDASFADALWQGHALHLAGQWKEARDAYQQAISIADRRLLELDQQTGPVEVEPDPNDEGRKFGGPVRNWKLERDREREIIQEDWPKLVLLAGQVEWMQLGDAESAVKTLSRGLRFAPEGESLEKLTEDARAALSETPKRPHPLWSRLMMPMATQRSMALAYEKLGDIESAARCWSRVHLSFLSYEVGMAVVDADHLVEIVSRVPGDKRQPFHELVLKNPGRRKPKPQEFDYQAALTKDQQNPFRVAAKLDEFDMTMLQSSHSSLAKLPDGRWIMAYTGGDAFQTRVYLSTSADGKQWDKPWEFAHNNLFPTRSPSLIVDDDGLIWMLCTSQRFELSRYSSGGYRLWLCSSRDGRNWSPLRPVKVAHEFQYQHTAQLTRDRQGKFWIFGHGQFASTDRPHELQSLSPLKLPDADKVSASDVFATFDERNRCHLVFGNGHDAIYRTSSTDMLAWEPLEKLAEKQANSRVAHPQLVIDGDRLTLLYETFSGYVRRGVFDGTQVTWSEPIAIGLPLSGSLLARDGDKVWIASGKVSAQIAPVLLNAPLSTLLRSETDDGQTK
ncbi:MAG: M48 family metalloprotease, partial [Planctomycetaceae bacterium]|nr:M48 family metalloprotease [Planctomycetaceae bacterium]